MEYLEGVTIFKVPFQHFLATLTKTIKTPEDNSRPQFEPSIPRIFDPVVTAIKFIPICLIF
jgi:hypothetical protein